MSRRRKGRDIHGIVLLDKPEGYSSNQAVQKVRWLFKAKKAGHTGSLDPFATGMLPICLGEASKTAGFMLDSSKTYVARARLGIATTTGDTEGEISRSEPVPGLDLVRIREVLAGFEGRIEQIPPMYSALKHQGQPLYKLAREGLTVEREPRSVTIHSLELTRWEPDIMVFRVHCSKGTYIRTLAEDIAAALGTCAHLEALRRLSVEPFRYQDMVDLESLVALAAEGRQDEALLPPEAGLSGWPAVFLDEGAASRFRHGNPVPAGEGPAGRVRVYGPAEKFLGLGEISVDRMLNPKRVMNL